MFNRDHTFPNQSILVTDNYVSSYSLFSNTDYILPPEELEDASKFTLEHRKR